MEIQKYETDWAQKYRPSKLEDMILPSSIKNPLIAIRDKGVGPSLLFSGRAGLGKTTAAMLLNSKNTLKINCSDKNKIADVRELDNCASKSVYLDDGMRIIVMDESDYLTASAQAALRATLEKMSCINLFVFTANEPKRLIKPIHSRLMPINFDDIFGDAKLKAEMVERACEIIENEQLNVKDKRIVQEIVNNHFPDMRSLLKKLQFEYQLS